MEKQEQDTKHAEKHSRDWHQEPPIGPPRFRVHKQKEEGE